MLHRHLQGIGASQEDDAEQPKSHQNVILCFSLPLSRTTATALRAPEGEAGDALGEEEDLQNLGTEPHLVEVTSACQRQGSLLAPHCTCCHINWSNKRFYVNVSHSTTSSPQARSTGVEWCLGVPLPQLEIICAAHMNGSNVCVAIEKEKDLFITAGF